MATRPSSHFDFTLIARALLVLLAFGLGGCGLGDTWLQPTLTPVVTRPPTETPLLLPDLALKDLVLEIERESADPCALPTGMRHIRLDVTNQGQSAAGPFSVSVNQIRQVVANGLASGETTSLWFPQYNLHVIAQIDAGDQVIESDETNNLADHYLAMPTSLPECQRTPTPAVMYAGPLATLEGHAGAVKTVAFSPGGSLIASGSVDNTLRLWNVKDAVLLRTMTGHPFPVLALDFSPDGTILATGSTDGLVRLWQVSDGRLQRSLRGHAGWISSLDFSSDGLLLASASDDFTVRIWRMINSRLAELIDEGMGAVTGVAFSPDRDTIAWSEANGVVRLRSLSGEWLHILNVTDQPATSLSFSPAGDYLATGYADGMVRIWEVSSGKLVQLLRAHDSGIADLAYAPNGLWLVTASEDGNLRLWHSDGAAFQNTPALILAGHTAPLTSVDFSPLSNLIVSGSEDHTVRLWAVPQE